MSVCQSAQCLFPKCNQKPPPAPRTLLSNRSGVCLLSLNCQIVSLSHSVLTSSLFLIFFPSLVARLGHRRLSFPFLHFYLSFAFYVYGYHYQHPKHTHTDTNTSPPPQTQTHTYTNKHIHSLSLPILKMTVSEKWNHFADQ